MRRFDALFMDVAAAECRALQPLDNPSLPAGTFLFRELYCTDSRSDCRRVLRHVWWAERKKVVATLNYGFEPPSRPFDDEPVVDDPSHADQRKVDAGFVPAFPMSASREPQRSAPKLGLDAPCPCGSGKKYKKCCRS